MSIELMALMELRRELRHLTVLRELGMRAGGESRERELEEKARGADGAIEANGDEEADKGR